MDARGESVRLAAHYAATVALASGDSVEQVLPQVLAGIGGALGWEFGGVWLVDEDVLRARAVWTSSPRFAPFAALTRATTLTRKLGLPGRVWAEGRAVWIRDVVDDGNFPRLEGARRVGLHAAFGFPIRHRDRLLGVIEFFCASLEESDPALLELLDGVGLQVGLFIERTALIEKLSDAQERLRIALEAGRMGTWEWEPASNHVHWSENLEDVHGIPRGSFPGTFEGYQRDLHPEDKARVLAALDATLVQRRGQLLEEYRIIRPDGAIRWLEARGAMVTDEHGEPARYLGICMDRTEHKETEAALKRALRMREEMLAVVSHDLRSPLAVVMTAAQLLARRHAGDPSIEDPVHRILRASDRMEHLLADLLDSAAIEAGRLSIEKQENDVGALMGEALEMLQPVAAVKAVRLHAHGDGTAHCDRERILQVLTNLVGNAIKFSGAGGQVALAADPVDGEVRVSVTDDGPGISADQLPHIFQPYWKGSRTAAGIGLGLFIVQGIVSAHSGRVWAESSAGAGARFVFTLPA